MKQLLQLTLTLTIIAALSGLAISSVNSTTKEPIKVQAAEKEKMALQEVLPSSLPYMADTLVVEEDTIPYWIAKDSLKNITGYAFKTESGKGYSSKIEYILALNTSGTILGLSILSQAETPGLGARVTEQLSSLTIWSKIAGQKEDGIIKPWFTEQFKGLNLHNQIGVTKGEEWHKLPQEKQAELINKNEVTAITGATITTQAVAKSITHSGKTLFPKIQAENEEEGE